MEGLVMALPKEAFWSGRRVLVTGHTGFKGGWLSTYLARLGARVHGYALDPWAENGFFNATKIDSVIASETRADVTDYAKLKSTLDEFAPEIVFHLAAQPLVRTAHGEPLETFRANVYGTACVLEAVRDTQCAEALVLITSDKVYSNYEWPYPYRENDDLGGEEPYSASKAAAELVANAYRASFFSGPDAPTQVATTRAGNVIGGGDRSPDRLLPDCLFAFEAGEPVRLRNPSAIRPWQHVLDPIVGYLILAERMVGQNGSRFASSWNFGPDINGDATVGRVAELASAAWGDGVEVKTAESMSSEPHEASILRLDSTAAHTKLNWHPRMNLEAAVDATVKWHKEWLRGTDMYDLTLQQIDTYERKRQ
jgi:CDP-glucose 4,6-dehydratase